MVNSSPFFKISWLFLIQESGVIPDQNQSSWIPLWEPENGRRQPLRAPGSDTHMNTNKNTHRRPDLSDMSCCSLSWRKSSLIHIYISDSRETSCQDSKSPNNGSSSRQLGEVLMAQPLQKFNTCAPQHHHRVVNACSITEIRWDLLSIRQEQQVKITQNSPAVDFSSRRNLQMWNIGVFMWQRGRVRHLKM